MKLIKASAKRSHGSGVFHIDILYPGLALGLHDTGFYTIGRVDHALFKPPGHVPMHPHRDDEILSYMRSGSQLHIDNTGREERLNNSRLMLMNAGRGFSHEEIAEQDVEMLQIFMRPSAQGYDPQVQFHQFEEAHSINDWRLVAGSTPNAPLSLRVDTDIFDVRLQQGHQIFPPTGYEKIQFLYIFSGTVSVEDIVANKGDSIVFDAGEHFVIDAKSVSDLLLFQITPDAEYTDKGMFSGNQYR